MPNTYLDEIYGLMPYGSDANPMNMEAMDVRPDDLRLADEISAERARGPQPVVRPLPPDENQVGSDANPMNMAAMDMRPDDLRLADEISAERARGPQPVVRPLPPDENQVGSDANPMNMAAMDMRPGPPMGPPSPYRTERKGNVEYIYGGEPDMAGVNRPRAPAPRGAPARAGGPPPGVVPASAGSVSPGPGRQTPAEPGQPGAAPGEWNGEYYAPGEKGSEWNQYLENPTAPNGRAAPADTRESLMNEAQNSPVPEDVSQIYDREMARQASLTPEQRVAENAKREFERNQMGLDDMAAESARRRVEAQQNLDAMLTARKKSQEEIDRLKAQPGWWDRRSTGQKVALFADAAFSGMLAAFQGSSRNTAIESMQGAIEQDAEERAAEFAQARQGMVDADEVFKLKEMVRLRGMEEAKGMILTRMAQYDKNGSMAAAGMAAVQDLDARQAEAEQKILEHNWKKELELRKITSEEAQKAASLQQSEIESRRAAGTARRGQDLSFRASQLANDSVKNAAELANVNARTRNAELEAQDKANQVAGGPGGNPYAFGDIRGNPYRQKDGTVFAVKDDTRRDKIDLTNQAAINVRRIADLVKIMREGTGGASAAVGSKEYQQLKSLEAQTAFETFKAYGLGAPSAGDQQLADAVRGGKDITSFIYAPEAGFEAFAQGLEDKLNAGMRSAGYNGKPVVIPRSRLATEGDVAKEEARAYSPGSFIQGSKYRQSAEEGAAERAADEPPPDYAPVYDDSIEDPWEKARRGR